MKLAASVLDAAVATRVMEVEQAVGEKVAGVPTPALRMESREAALAQLAVVKLPEAEVRVTVSNSEQPVDGTGGKGGGEGAGGGVGVGGGVGGGEGDGGGEGGGGGLGGGLGEGGGEGGGELQGVLRTWTQKAAWAKTGVVSCAGRKPLKAACAGK